MDVSEAQKLKAMEDENRRLKQMVTDLSLNKEALKSVRRKTAGACRPEGEVAFVQAEHGLSERRACKLLVMERSSYRYEPRPDRNVALRGELVKLARESLATVIAGCALLSRRGEEVNVKRVYRLYVEEKRMVRRKKSKRLSASVPWNRGCCKPIRSGRWTSSPMVWRPGAWC